MRIAIVQFPGSNCERETSLAVKRAGMEPVEFLWNGPRDMLQEMAGYIIVGGFSYEDRSRAGIIAALDPVMTEIAAQSEKGKPVLGICNGAQILVETGLVPGLENNRVGMALTENRRVAEGKVLGTGYYNAWVNMRLSDQYQRNAFTRRLTSKNILSVPVAHGEGRFIMTEGLLNEIIEQGLHVFQYCDADGSIVDAFPVNPNGSIQNIAAIANKAGNVMAMMPHPERTLNGDLMFQSMHDHITESRFEHAIPLNYYPRRQVFTRYKKPMQHHECIVELMITDNQALTVQNTLRQMGMLVTVRRHVHWEIQCNTSDILQQIKQSGVLFNPRKEVEVLPETLKTDHSMCYLVRAKEDWIGRQKQQLLKDHFSIPEIQLIRQGILWQFTAENGNMSNLIDNILHSNIIHNPYAHECCQYDPFLS